MRRRRAGAVLAGAVLLLGACATEPDAESDGGGSGAESAAPEREAEQEQAEPGPEAEDLADQAEDLAQSGRIPPLDGEVLGGDISWPQCPRGMGIPQKRTLGMPMPLEDARYVVVGLTNGPGLTPNPCLAEQVDWVTERGLLISAYSVASFPDSGTLFDDGDDGPFDAATRAGKLRNAGYQQALYNVSSMRDADLETPFVWIDVEPVPDFEWSDDVAANAAVVEGIARGYTESGYDIGVYSTPALWAGVVGDLELGIPEWRAAGQTSAEEALSRCGADWVIQGGEAVMGQWVEADRDQNLTCPGVAADLNPYFHQT